jgi:hypothetical protein
MRLVPAKRKPGERGQEHEVGASVHLGASLSVCLMAWVVAHPGGFVVRAAPIRLKLR